MKAKFLKFFWIILVAAAAFTLGYTLKPTAERPRPFGAMMGAPPGYAPPLNFGGRR